MPPRLVAFSIASVRSRRAGPRRRRRRRRRRGSRSPGSGRRRRPDARRAGARAARGRLHRVEPHLQRLQPALEQPRRVGRRDEPGEPAREVEALVELVVGDRGDAGEESSCPPSTLVALCSATSQPSSSGRRRSGDASVASQTTGAGWAAAASKSGIVSIGFDGASSRIEVGVRGRRPGLVVLDHVDAPRLEVVEELPVPVVGALGERDRPARGSIVRRPR